MTRVEYLQEKHDALVETISEKLAAYVTNTDHRAELESLINQYGNTCIKLVEAEHAECGS